MVSPMYLADVIAIVEDVIPHYCRLIFDHVTDGTPHVTADVIFDCGRWYLPLIDWLMLLPWQME